MGLLNAILKFIRGRGISWTIDLGSDYSTKDEPVKPPVTFSRSQNFTARPGREISCIILHATATAGLASPLSWLCDPASQVSAHYLIDLDGTLYQLVPDEHISWHAGKSAWRGRSGVNAFSIGIEMVNPNDGKTPYPEAQLFSCSQLCSYLMATYGIGRGDVTSHAKVATPAGRKNDPLGFDWEAFYAALEAQ